MVTNGGTYTLLKELELLEDRDIWFSKDDSLEILKKQLPTELVNNMIAIRGPTTYVAE